MMYRSLDYFQMIRTLVLLVAMAVCLSTIAQPAAKDTAGPKPIDILAGRKDVEPRIELLGERYEDKLAGISLRTPINLKQLQNITSDEVAEFTDEANGWTLKVTKPTFPNSVPLTTEKDHDGKVIRTGLLDYTVDELMAQNPSARLPLRKDVITVENYYVGMIALCYTKDLKRVLRQQAIVQANDQLYYLLIMTTPAGSLEADENNEKITADLKVQEAIKSFVSMVDSVKILDRAPIKEDQNARLFRTRSLLLMWKNPKKFESIRIEKQYLRYILNGKDVGYSFIEELPNDSRLSNVDGDGAIVYERTRLIGADAKGNRLITDIGAFEAVSLDMNHERWLRNILESDYTDVDHPKTVTVGDVGESSYGKKLKLDWHNGVIQPGENPKNAPPMIPVDYHSMSVSVLVKNSNPLIVKADLPPFYLPLAARHLLPRMVVDHSLRGVRTYLFYTYIPETRDVRALYVDVSEEKKTTFNGQDIMAITVAERVGLAGSPMFHYVTAEGKYLGSEKPAAKYKVIISDEAELLNIWPAATLTRPNSVK